MRSSLIGTECTVERNVNPYFRTLHDFEVKINGSVTSDEQG